MQKVAAAPGHPHHEGKANGQDKAVDGTSEDEQLLRSGVNGHEDHRAHHNEDDGEDITGARRGLLGGHKGHRGIGRTDNGGQTGSEEDYAEGTQAELASGMVERIGRGVVIGKRHPSGYHAEHRQEEEHAHDAGYHDAADRGIGNVLDVFHAGVARINESVRAGKSDIAAHGATDDGGNDEEVNLAWRDGIL